MARIHIVGAGLAGLAAAVRLAVRGAGIVIYEAAPRAGGRARSYFDAQLGCVIDNGNHLILSGNHGVLSYMKAIGAEDRLAGPSSADFPFVDARSRARWTLRPGASTIPWWLLDPERRVPDTRLTDYLSIACMLRAHEGDTVAARIGRKGALYSGFWEPLTVAVLNTAPEEAAAALMRPVLAETFLKGAAACRPLVARTSLADSLVDPAVAHLTRLGADIKFGVRVRSLIPGAGRIAAIDLDGTVIPLDADDMVILAVPPWIAQTILAEAVPDLIAPPPGEPIVNVHYRVPALQVADGEARIVGVIGGLAQWVFARADLASVTISAAGAVADRPAEDIARACWPEVALALDLDPAQEPPARVVKERRATFAQTPAALRLRPACATRLDNLLLAGDWTATGLPATLEGAVRSGYTAAALAGAKHQGATKAA